MKRRAERRLDRALLLFAASAVLGGCGIGYSIALPNTLAGSIALGAGLVVICLGTQALRWRFRAMAKERLKLMRGAQGEALTSWLLSRLPGDWHVFNNVLLGPDWDVDHVVVGPRGLFCVSTKSWRGLLGERGGEFCHNNIPTDVLRSARLQAVTLHGQLRTHSGGAPVPYVHPVLSVPLAHVEGFGPGPFQKVYVAHQENLTETIEQFGDELDPARVAACVAAIQKLAATPPARAGRRPTLRPAA